MKEPSNNPFSDPNEPKPAPKGAKASVGDIFAANTSANVQPAYYALPTTPKHTVHQSSGRVGSAALPLFVAGVPLAALSIGALYFWVYQFGNVALFSEMAFGFALGCALWPLIKAGKCRNRAIAVGVATVAALLAYSTFLGLSAWSQREEYVAGFTQAITRRNGLPTAQVRPRVEQFLSPPRYFRLWMQDRAQSGISLVSTDSHRIRGASSGTAMTFQGAGFWFYLAGQIGLVAIFAILAALGAAGARFNEEKDRWWKKKFFYDVHPAHIDAIVECAQKGDWGMVGKIGRESKIDGNSGAQVAVYTCPPDTEAILSIYPPGKANNPFWEGPIPPEGLALFPRIGQKSP